MTTKQTTTEQIEALEHKLAATDEKARTSTQAERDKLEALRSQLAAENAAEHQRLTQHRRAWAEYYLATQRQDEETAARQNVTAARRAFEAELAQAPWVVALMDWQRALNEQVAVSERTAYAHQLAGHAATVPASAPNVLPMLDGEVSFTPLGRMLHYLAERVEHPNVAAEVDALPTPEATSVSKDEPLAYLARTGARLDVTKHTDDEGNVRTMHRNLTTGEWVKVGPDGSTHASWQEAKATGQPTNPIDGRQFGSEYDDRLGKFVKKRVA